MTVGDTFSDAVDVNDRLLVRDDARHQDHLAIRPRDHPAAGCRLLDAQ
jgi:hypothetical protein